MLSPKNATNIIIAALVLATLLVIVNVLNTKPITPDTEQPPVPEVTVITAPVDGQPATTTVVAPLEETAVAPTPSN